MQQHPEALARLVRLQPLEGVRAFLLGLRERLAVALGLLRRGGDRRGHGARYAVG